MAEFLHHFADMASQTGRVLQETGIFLRHIQTVSGAFLQALMDANRKK